MKNLRPTARICVFILLFAVVNVFGADQLHHILEAGETLYSVSRIYKIPYEALAAANGITDPTKVKTGTVLAIPTIHVVEKGETLYGISRKYGIAIAQLLSANRLKSDYVLKIGDALIIPASQSSETPAAPQTAAPTPSSTPAPPSTTAAKPPAPSPAPTAVSPTVTPSVTPTVPSQAPANGTAAPAVQPPSPPSAASPASPPVATQPAASNAQAVPMPAPVKTQDKEVDAKLLWPVEGKAAYLDGKLEGIMFKPKPGESAKAVASGTVVSAGPSRGFNQVVFVQSKAGYVYVYGGNETVLVKTGDQVKSGQDLGKIGLDPKDSTPVAYFFVFRNGQPVDPATAPRD